jgi:curved DNA-binding protein CbpA
MNPYLVLGVPRGADDGRIRQAYLDALKKTPPETHPVRFKEIAAAYEKIKDEPNRCRYDLFDTDGPGETPFDAILNYARLTVQPAPLGFDMMKEFLRACSKT